MKVLCFGSLNVDYVYRVPHFVVPGETLASESLCRYSGGKGLNQAIALAKAGARTAMAGCVGEDAAFLLDELQAAGVNTDRVCVKDVPTGHAVIQNTPDGENAILLYGGANRTHTVQQIRETLSVLAPGDLVLLQNEINGNREIICEAKEYGLRLAMNPSPMDSDMLSLPLEELDYLILNRVEAAQLLGGKGEPDPMLEILRRRFPDTLVVLTIGASGALACQGDKRFFQPAFPVRPVDTTGAGDTFTGYFLAEFCRSSSIEKALRLAAAAAALAVTRPGASPSIPVLEEVQHFLHSEA